MKNTPVAARLPAEAPRRVSRRKRRVRASRFLACLAGFLCVADILLLLALR